MRILRFTVCAGSTLRRHCSFSDNEAFITRTAQSLHFLRSLPSLLLVRTLPSLATGIAFRGLSWKQASYISVEKGSIVSIEYELDK